MIRRILVGLGDEAYAASATQTAIDLARQHEAELTGICVLDLERVGYTGPVPIGAGHLAKELREHHIAEVRQVVDVLSENFSRACEENGVCHRLITNEGEPYQSLISAARYHDLVVCGAKHLFEHGVVDEPPDELAKLVQSGVLPLLVVTHKPLRVDRTLIAYSGSMESANTLARYLQLRLWPEVPIRIVTFKHRRGNEVAMLDEAASYCRAHGYEVTTEFVPELARLNVLPYARRWNADLIVMGNSKKSLLLRRILGETMLHTVKHSDRPLFLAQ